MKRFGILQTAFPARGTRSPAGASYVPRVTWRLLHSAGRRHGLQVLFFRAEDVDFHENKVHAWSSTSSDGMSAWTRQWHPLPDVVYENYPMDPKAVRARAKRVKRTFAGLGVPVFNPVFFNKADLQTILSHEPSIAQYLPKGRVAGTRADVTSFLKEHRTAYLKPIDGYQGRGIIEVRLLNGNRVRVKSDKFRGGRSLLRKCSLSKFQSFAGRLLKKRRYLIQQGLDLLKKGERKIDFRVVLHRGADGKWQCVGIRPKLGRPGSMVTNSHAGGSKTTWEKLERWARRTHTPLPSAAELQTPALLAAEHLTRYRPTLSHMGVDVGVDSPRGIYLLDFNVVPGRDLLTSDMLRRATDLTAGFAAHLAGSRRQHSPR
ncbi:YheC/YheD family protein [Paenibacillus xerothermodurans]|uniref:ATP-grasp domain-containing protein n=1 Tax=Paenibacillus xerothermodurans TaxID=1977292 RepID=A0A2W1NE80_PAEXE|nr:YheC/YheD family protein [Paenibacillus xerothermodurans]PZE21431.1 hypothetical protein CBW46_008775 [Paenibacillus xerothermodurans]